MRNTGERFELDVEGGTTFADYSLAGADLRILHVETPPELRGQGAAAKLMEEIATYAHKQNLKIIPVCTYAASWLQKHGER